MMMTVASTTMKTATMIMTEIATVMITELSVIVTNYDGDDQNDTDYINVESDDGGGAVAAADEDSGRYRNEGIDNDVDDVDTRTYIRVHHRPNRSRHAQNHLPGYG